MSIEGRYQRILENYELEGHVSKSPQFATNKVKGAFGVELDTKKYGVIDTVKAYVKQLFGYGEVVTLKSKVYYVPEKSRDAFLERYRKSTPEALFQGHTLQEFINSRDEFKHIVYETKTMYTTYDPKVVDAAYNGENKRITQILEHIGQAKENEKLSDMDRGVLYNSFKYSKGPIKELQDKLSVTYGEFKKALTEQKELFDKDRSQAAATCNYELLEKYYKEAYKK